MNEKPFWQRWIEAVYLRDGLSSVLYAGITVVLISLAAMMILQEVLGWELGALLGP